MCLKLIKLGLLSTAGVAIVGGLVFGRELTSYVSSSTHQVRMAVKNAVPIEFELQRARDLVGDIVPEMQANVRAIAQQEVEIESLRADINESEKSLSAENIRVAKLRDALGSAETCSYTFGGHSYTRDQIKEDLARRFDTVREAQTILSGKKRLLENREKSLVAAEQMLEKARNQKALLESQIAALEGQHRLVQAASVGSTVAIDNTKLAQSQKLIREIKQQLDVAERVLSHESRFVEPIQVDTVTEKDLLTQVNEYLGTAPKAETASAK